MGSTVLASALADDIHGRRAATRQEIDAVVARARDVMTSSGSAPAIEPWKTNQNANLYVVRWRGRAGVLKVLVGKDPARLRREFEQLELLSSAAASTGTFRVPEPWFAIEGGYVCELIDAPSVAALATAARFDSHALERACRQAGVALAGLHAGRTDGARPIDAHGILGDVEQHAPWELARRERELLHRTLDRLHTVPIAHGNPYADFDAVNVLVPSTGAVVLLDPPDLQTIGPLYWDVGVFASGLRRACWRRPHLMLTRAPYIDRAVAEAQAAYWSALGQLRPPRPAEDLLLALFEYLRIAQLWIWWKSPRHSRFRAAATARTLVGVGFVQWTRRACLTRMQEALA